MGISWLSRRYLDKLRRAHQPPKKYRPKNKKHVLSMKFLNDHGIPPFYYPTSSSRAALLILEHSRVRESLEALLLSACPLVVICHSLESWHGVKYEPEVLELYRDLFFDTARLSQVELRALLELQAEASRRSPDPEVRAQYRALRLASRHDPRRVAASMPNGKLAAMAAAWKSGKWPTALDVHGTLERVRDTAILRSAISVGGGTPDVEMAWVQVPICSGVLTKNGRNSGEFAERG